MGGSTGGWASDTSLDGAGGLSTVLGEPFYVGVIDGVSITSSELHSDPFNINFAFSGETVSIPSASFGLPGPTLSGPSTMTSIGIVNIFNLEGGDSVSSSNYFIVEAIPKPSMMGLLTTSSLACGAGKNPDCSKPTLNLQSVHNTTESQGAVEFMAKIHK